MNSKETQNLEMEEERQQKRWKKMISQIGGKLGENDSIDTKGGGGCVSRKRKQCISAAERSSTG